MRQYNMRKESKRFLSSSLNLFHSPFCSIVYLCLCFSLQFHAEAFVSNTTSIAEFDTGVQVDNELNTESISLNEAVDTTTSGVPEADTDAFESMVVTETSVVPIDYTVSYSLNLTVTPSSEANHYVNCTDVEFRCEAASNETDLFSAKPLSIWWTFQGINVSASTLPGGRVTNENNASVLSVSCAQFGIHNGEYQCHSAIGESGKTSKNITIEIDIPLSIVSLDPSNGTVKDQIDSKVQLKCHILAYPKPHVIWQRTDLNTLTVSDIEVDGRILIETKLYPESEPTEITDSLETAVAAGDSARIQVTTVESVLIFKSLMRHDNGSYTCKAMSSGPVPEKPLLSHFNVIVLEVPEIHIEKLEIENKTTVLLTFAEDYDGNLPIDKFILEVMNFSIPNASWTSINVPLTFNHQNYSSIKIESLMPGASYGFRLAGKNSVDQSEWSYMNISVPPDVPSTIMNVHLLSKSNETLLFGWRRPMYDNGGTITLYQMTLKDANDTLISNQTLDTLSSSSGNIQSRNNYMLMFPNLQSGSNYYFQVRACSLIGCSVWSPVLEAITNDGYADPPLNLKIHCSFDVGSLENHAIITWEPPDNPRGSIQGYNITLEGHSNYKNANSRLILDHFRQHYEVAKEVFKYQILLKPNSNYTLRLCTINRAGCGQLSHITSSSMCHSAPITPSEFPPNTKFEQNKPAFVNPNNDEKEVHIPPSGPSRQLKLHVSRIGERNGPIKCYRIIIMRLPTLPPDTNSSGTDPEHKMKLYEQYVPDSADKVTLSTYKHVHQSENNELGAYIATEFSSENFHEEITIGDGVSERCFDDYSDNDVRSRIRTNSLVASEDNRSPRRINYDYNIDFKLNESNESWKNAVENGELRPNTNYTGFVEVCVITWNNTILYARSPFFEPVETDPAHVFEPALSKSTFSETTSGILLGTIFALILVLILFLSVLCFLKRKATETPSNMIESEPIGLTTLIRRTMGKQRKSSIFYHINFNSLNSVKKWASRPISIHNLMAAFQEKHANSDFMFQAEFEALPESFSDRTTVHSDDHENACKNRYPDIKSYDQTRVCLSKIPDIPGSDYINADLVSGYKNKKQFICAQGPLQKTIDDFWRMIYEQQCCIIVMLTGIEEQGRIKCAQYWNDDKPLEVEQNLKVTLICRRDYSDYVIRRFSLENTNSGECRDVLHFHFVAWKDFLAPEQPSWLLRFIKRVNEHHCPDRGPILVHCSAGVGRTGTFIAIDTLTSQIDDGVTHINVFECVCRLRRQRNYLVQSIKQYIFVYRAVMEYIEFGDTEIEATHLSEQYKELKEQKFDCGNGIIMEFTKLNEVLEDPKSFVVGTMDMNVSKNRYSFIIPYDVNRVILNPSSTKDHSYYINASCIWGYDHIMSFIVAQDPMEHTVNEFWWMIAEHNVTTLVMLAELGDGQSKCHCYWPNEEFDCDYVKVKLIEEEMSQYYTKRVFNVTQKKTNKNHLVNQFQFLAWKSGVLPESTISLIKLTDTVLANNSPSSSPILVHCSGGGDRSSVFVAFASLVKQLKIEERVDIFQTARYTKSQRQCMLQSVAQYDFLYRCVIDYINHHHIGQNGDTHL